MGIITGHAYSVLDAQEVAGGHKLVCIRNPWGSGEWMGDFSDPVPGKPTMWTDEIKAQLKPTFANDGLFWMKFDDMVKFFANVYISFSHSERGKEYKDWRQPVKFLRTKAGDPRTFYAPNFYEFTNLDEGANFVFGLHQRDPRNVKNPPLVDIAFWVVNNNTKQVRLLDEAGWLSLLPLSHKHPHTSACCCCF